MRKAVTSLPPMRIGLIAANGKASGASPAGSSTTFCRVVRALGPQIPMVTYFSVTSVTVTSKPLSSAIRLT